MKVQATHCPPVEDVMPAENPIACSLSAEQMPARLAEMSAIGRASLIDVTTTGRQAILRFRPAQGIRVRLGRIVVAELQCCAFLAFHLQDGPEPIEMTLTAPPRAEAILDDMAA